MLRRLSYIFLFLLLAGCNLSSAEEMFRVPEMPEEYEEFYAQVSEIRANGGELTTPTDGFNRQAVQLMDLDNDGLDEGILFVKQGEKEKSVCAYVFKKYGDEYKLHEQIEGKGNTVESVSYSDIVGNGNYAMIIGWGLEDNSAKTLTAYEIEENGMKKLMEAPYLYCAEADSDSDGVIDLNIVMPDEKNKALELAFFTQYMGEFRMQSVAHLSQGVSEIKKIRTGNGTDGIPCVFIDSVFPDGRMVTDMFTCRGTKVVNITRSQESGISDFSLRKLVCPSEDINGDGIIEIPVPEPLPGHEDKKESEKLYGMSWLKYDGKGGFKADMYSYHDYVDEWHIILPDKWKGRITAERAEGDRGVVFYSADEKHERLFSIYALTGEERYDRATYSGRFQITEKVNVIYAATIEKEKYLGVEITAESLREMFHWRETEWSAGEVVA